MTSETRTPQPGESSTTPEITKLPEGFKVPSDKNVGGTIPDGYLPQTGGDRPELKK